MNLSVPLIRQDTHSSDCGLACIAMIMTNYGITQSVDTLKKDIRLFKNVGTYLPQLGLYLVKHGYEVEIITMNPHLFNTSFRNVSQKKILTHLKHKYIVAKKRERRMGIRFFIQFIEAGGKITVKVPGAEDIQQELDQKRPLIAQLTSNFLRNKYQGFNFHYNVITGIDNSEITVNDPLYSKSQLYNTHEYLYAIHAAAYGEVDNAAIMKIRYKKHT